MTVVIFLFLFIFHFVVNIYSTPGLNAFCSSDNHFILLIIFFFIIFFNFYCLLTDYVQNMTQPKIISGL